MVEPGGKVLRMNSSNRQQGHAVVKSKSMAKRKDSPILRSDFEFGPASKNEEGSLEVEECKVFAARLQTKHATQEPEYFRVNPDLGIKNPLKMKVFVVQGHHSSTIRDILVV